MLPGETILSGANPHCPDCGKRFEFEVLSSAAGAYIGTACCCGPYTRETGYFKSRQDAQVLLDNGTWQEHARK